MDGAHIIIEWQANNAGIEEQRDEAAVLLRDAKIACNCDAGKERLERRTFNPKAYKASVRNAISQIADLKKRKADSDSRQLIGRRRRLRELLQTGKQEFLDHNAADEVQKKAALALLEDAQEACKVKMGKGRTTSIIFNRDGLNRRLNFLESRKAERVSVNAKILKGSEDRSRRTYPQRNWSEIMTRTGNAVRAFLVQGNNCMSNEKEKYSRRLERCLTFSPREKRIMDDCSKLVRDKDKVPDVYRKTLLETNEKGETLQKAIEAMRKEWEDHFIQLQNKNSTNATEESARDSDYSDRDSSTDSAGLFEEFCIYPDSESEETKLA